MYHTDFCVSSCIFPSNGSPSRCSPSLAYRSGSLRSRFPCVRYYDYTKTAHRPSRSLRFCYSPGTISSLLFRIAAHFIMRSLFSPGAEKSPVYLYPALSVGGFLPTETMSPHTFPYDLLYICPALGPRPRWSHSLIVLPRPLPHAKQ